MKRYNPKASAKANPKAAKPPRARRPRPGDGLPPGFPYPCEHAMVGRRVSGDDFAGSVIGCSTPPEGKRGRYLFVGGKAVSKAKITSAQRASAKTRATLNERWSAPDAPDFARPSRPPTAPGIRGLLPAPRAAMPSLPPMLAAPMFLPPMRRGEMAGPAWTPRPVPPPATATPATAQRILDVSRSIPYGDDNGWGNDGPLWRMLAVRLLSMASPMTGTPRQIEAALDIRAKMAERMAQVLATSAGQDAQTLKYRNVHPGPRTVEWQRHQAELFARMLSNSAARAWLDARSRISEAIGGRPELLASTLDDVGFDRASATPAAPSTASLSPDEDLFLQGIHLSNRHAELTDTKDNPWGLFWGFANILVHRGFKQRPRYEFTEESLRAGWPSAEFRAAFDTLHGGSFDFLIGSTGRVRSDKEGLEHYRRILPNFDKMLGEATRVADSRKPSHYVGALEELARATAYADWPNEGDISWKVGVAESSMDPSNRSEGSANSIAQKFMSAANGLDQDATLVELLSGPSESVNHARATASRLHREGQGILDGGASLIAQANDLIQNADVIRSRNVEVVPLESIRSSKTTFERNKVEPGRYLSNGHIVIDGQVKGAKADRIKTLSAAGGGGSTPQAVVAKHFAMATGSKVIPLTFGGVIRADRVNLFLVWFSDDPDMPVVFVAGDQAALIRSSVGQWDTGGMTKRAEGHGVVWFYRKGVPIAGVTIWNASHLPTFDIPTLRDRLLGKRTNGPMARHRTRHPTRFDPLSVQGQGARDGA